MGLTEPFLNRISGYSYFYELSLAIFATRTLKDSECYWFNVALRVSMQILNCTENLDKL